MYELPLLIFVDNREDADWIADRLDDRYPNGRFSAEESTNGERWVVCGENDYDHLGQNYLKGYATCLKHNLFEA